MKEIIEIIERVESIEEFKEWCEIEHCFFDDVHIGGGTSEIWDFMPDTAKLALIQEWLREDKEIIIEPCRDNYCDWKCEIEYKGESGYWKHTQTKFVYRYYNKALSKGIEEALNILEI